MNMVQRIILGGILHSYHVQGDTIQKLEAKVSSLEAELKTSNCRIESLENWMIKSDELIKSNQKCIENYRKENVETKEKIESSNVPEKYSMMKFNLCDEVFRKNSDFENHMVDQHAVEKNFECGICGKKFLLQWRLKKHGLIHTMAAKQCKYILNKQLCPFEEVGCAFSHNNVEEPNVEEIIDEEHLVEEQIDDEDVEIDYDQLKKNQCHLCYDQLSTKDELWIHVENNHVEYFQGMLEFAASTN